MRPIGLNRMVLLKSLKVERVNNLSSFQTLIIFRRACKHTIVRLCAQLAVSDSVTLFAVSLQYTFEITICSNYEIATICFGHRPYRGFAAGKRAPRRFLNSIPPFCQSVVSEWNSFRDPGACIISGGESLTTRSPRWLYAIRFNVINVLWRRVNWLQYESICRLWSLLPPSLSPSLSLSLPAVLRRRIPPFFQLDLITRFLPRGDSRARYLSFFPLTIERSHRSFLGQ